MTFKTNPYSQLVRAQKVPLGDLLTWLHDGDLEAKSRSDANDPITDEWLKLVLLGLPNKRVVMLSREGPDVMSGYGAKWLNHMYNVWDGTQVLDLDKDSPFYDALESAAGKPYEKWPKAVRQAFWNFEVSIIVIYADQFETQEELRAVMGLYTV